MVGKLQKVLPNSLNKDFEEEITMNLKINIKWNVDKDHTIEQAKKVLFDCMIKMQELAVLYAPGDTGLLRSRIKFYPQSPGFLKYILTDGVEYGVDVEYGTDPHVVKLEPLLDWSRRVLGYEDAAYAVANKIAKYGTEAKPFMRPALAQVKNIWVQRFWEQNLGK